MRSIASVYRSLIDLGIDWRYNINTMGVVETNVSDDSFHASTVPYPTLQYLIRQLQLTDTDVFVDIGCGKGRVLAVAAQYRVLKVIGIEASGLMAGFAEQNMAKLKKQVADIHVVCTGAEDFNYVQCTAGYCFNAFGARTLDLVLHKIEQDRAGKPYPFRLLFLNPAADRMDVFREHYWVEHARGEAHSMPWVLMHSHY